jgi:hypothetical protein
MVCVRARGGGGEGPRREAVRPRTPERGEGAQPVLREMRVLRGGGGGGGGGGEGEGEGGGGGPGCSQSKKRAFKPDSNLTTIS